jgi:pimeloyl-ACP methyl ester carboxylesterase
MSSLTPTLGPAALDATEQSRARYPDEEGFIERNGVRVFYERYGDGQETVLLLPPWSIVHSRVWKLQIPYLAGLFRVLTFDGRGNGRSDRPSGAERYRTEEFARDALAVTMTRPHLRPPHLASASIGWTPPAPRVRRWWGTRVGRRAR